MKVPVDDFVIKHGASELAYVSLLILSVPNSEKGGRLLQVDSQRLVKL